MRRRHTLIFCALLFSAWAQAAPVGEAELKACKLEILDTGAEEALKGKDVQDLYRQDGFLSFLLKARAPHLMKDKILFWQEFVNCGTFRNENLDDWAGCLRPRLGKNEVKYLDNYIVCARKTAPKK